MDETVSIQKCKCGENFVLTIAGLKCPKCDLIKPKRPYTKKEGVKYGRPKKQIVVDSPQGHQE